VVAGPFFPFHVERKKKKKKERKKRKKGAGNAW
jgi:hypothetical protein